MVKKLLVLFVSLFLISNVYAQEEVKIFPQQSVLPFLGLDDTSFFDQANNQIGGQTFSSKINQDDNNGGGGIDDVPF